MDSAAGIFAAVADPRNAGVLAIAFAVMTFAIKVAPPDMLESGLLARMLPVIPVPLCMALVWIPGLEVAAALGWGDKLALGAALGTAMSWGYKVWMQTILGKDRRIGGAE